MSLRFEQYRALEYSRDFMRDLLNPTKTPRVPRAIRERASRCLRHYPFLDKNGAPMFSQDKVSVGNADISDAAPPAASNARQP